LVQKFQKPIGNGLSHDIVVEMAKLLSDRVLEFHRPLSQDRLCAAARLPHSSATVAEFVTCHHPPCKRLHPSRARFGRIPPVACESIVVCFRARNYILRILIPHGALYFNMHDFWSRRVILRRKDDRQNAPLKDWFPKMPSSFDVLSKF
jgi:hypothetical protein